MSKYNNIEWNMIKGLGNRIVHDYEGISLKSIWYVINNDIIDLKECVQTILKKEKNEEQKLFKEKLKKLKKQLKKKWTGF